MCIYRSALQISLIFISLFLTFSLATPEHVQAQPGRDNPQIGVNPEDISFEIDQGMFATREVTIRNSGDEELVFHPELAFGEAPNIDNFENMDILIITSGGGRGGNRAMWELSVLAGVPEENIVEEVPRALRNINLYNFDVIVFIDYQESIYYQCINWYRPELQEWVENGGILIASLYQAYTYPFIVLPGGPRLIYNAFMGWANVNDRHEDADINNPIIRGFIDDEDDDLGEQFSGRNASRAFFDSNQIMELEDIDNLQIFYYQSQMPEFITCFTYEMGAGHVLATSCNTTGFWYTPIDGWGGNGEWDETTRFFGRNLVVWADWLNSTIPISIDRENDLISLDPDRETEIELLFDTNNIVAGVYNADLQLYSNDPEDSLHVVGIEMTVNALPMITAYWHPHAGYPDIFDYNLRNEDLFVNVEYTELIKVTNIGSANLQIDRIEFEGEGAGFLNAEPAQNFAPIGERESMEITVLLEGNAVGEFNPNMIIHSNDQNIPELIIDIHATLSPQPEISIDPMQIGEIELLGAQEHTEQLIIINEAAGLLRYEIEKEWLVSPNRFEFLDNNGPRRDFPGQELASFNLGEEIFQPNDDPDWINNYSASCTWDKDREVMWMFAMHCVAIDPHNNLEVLDRFGLETGGDNLCYYDNILHMSPTNRDMFVTRYDLNGERIENLNLDMRDRLIRVYTIDPNDGLIFAIGSAINRPGQEFLVFNYEGERIANLGNISDLIAGVMVWDMEWVPNHVDGQLWLHTEDCFWQIGVDTENWEFTGIRQRLTGDNGFAANGFAHDGENLWITSAEDGLCRIVDDGIREAHWLDVEPISGEIDGQGDVEISVNFNGTAHRVGEYRAVLHIFSNDVSDPEIIVPVSARVEPAPQIHLTWSWDHGFNADEVNWAVNYNMAFEDVFNGVEYIVPVSIRNVGAEELIIESIVCNDNRFTAIPSEFVLQPDGQQEVVFRMVSEEPGVAEAIMSIRSNDPHHELIEIPLNAEISNPPIFIIEPDRIEERLDAGDEVETVLNLANDGEANLRWSSHLVVFDDEEQGMPGRDPDVGDSGQDVRFTESTDVRIPHRDNPGRRYFVYQAGMDQGRVYEHVYSRVNDLDWDWFQTTEELDEIDWSDYDVGWICSGMDQAGYRGWLDENSEMLEEWVSAGNVLYIEQGFRPGRLPPVDLAPGNIGWINDPQQGILAVGPDENWLVEQMGWELGHQFSITFINHPLFTDIAYDEEDFANLENSAYYQVIMRGNVHDTPTIVQYGFGRGTVIVSGNQPGRQWAFYREEGQFGSCAQVMVEYLGILSEHPWIDWSPKSDVLEPGVDNDIIVWLTADDLNAGEHEATIRFESNDPESPVIDVEVLLTVDGFPIPDVVWDEDAGYPDDINFNDIYDPIFTTGSYPVDITILNEGSDVLPIESIVSDEESILTNWDLEEQSEVPPDEEIVIQAILSDDEPGVYEGAITITFEGDFEVVEIPVSGEISAGPVMEIDPEEFEVDLIAGEAAELELNISNTGEAVLQWMSEMRVVQGPEIEEFGPVRDDPGDVIQDVRIPGARAQASRQVTWDYDNELIWVSQYGGANGPGIVWALDPRANYEIVEEFNVGNMVSSISYIEGRIWIPTRQGGWFLYDRDGDIIEEIGRGDDGTIIAAATYSQERDMIIYFIGWPRVNNQCPIRFYSRNEDGDFVNLEATIAGIENIMADRIGECRYRNICWVDDHEGGSLWFATGGNGGNIAWQVSCDLENETMEYVQHFWTIPNAVSSTMSGIAHNGTDLIVTGISILGVRFIDDGYTESGWLSWNPQMGSINPDDNIVMTVNINTEGFNGGEYVAELDLYSNDPREHREADFIVPININVTGNPQIEVVPGGEDQDPIEFGTGYFGFPIEKNVVVFNIGSDVLRINEVRIDDEIPDFFVEEDDIEGLEINPGETADLPVYYLPNADRDGELEATLMFMTNDQNWEEGYPVVCHSDQALPAPALVIEPMELNIEIGAEEVVETPVTARNTGDSDLNFSTEIIMIDPDELPAFGENVSNREAVPVINRNRNPREIRRENSGPRRDQPQGRGILVQNRNPWYNWQFDQYFEAIEGLEYRRCRSWQEFDALDLEEWDFLWIGNNEGPQFINDCNQRLEDIEEFVSGGGALYFSSGSIQIDTRPINPGGITFSGNAFQRAVPLLLDPEDNYLVNYMNENDPFGNEWQEGMVITGVNEMNPVGTGYFVDEDFENNDQIDWYQPMVGANPNEGYIAVTYKFGLGYCLITTTWDGYHHNWPNESAWGRTGEGIIWYLDRLSSETTTLWITPRRGTIEADQELELTVIVNSAGLNEGITEGQIVFNSNDPENPQQVLSVLISVEGIAQIVGEPVPFPLEGAEELNINDDGIEYVIDHEYRIPVSLTNIGNAVVEIEGFASDDEDNWGFEIPVQQINPGQSLGANFLFHPTRIGEHNATIQLETSAANIEEGRIWWILNATALDHPELELLIPNEADSVFAEVDVDGESAETTIQLRNVNAENRSTLCFDIFSNERGAPEEGQEIWERLPGAFRGSAGSIIETHLVNIQYTQGMTFDGELVWGADIVQNRLAGMNKITFEMENEIELDFRPAGLTFIDGVLWCGNGNTNNVHLFDLEGNEIEVREFGTTLIGLAYDNNGHVLINSTFDNRIHVLDIDAWEEIALINQLPGWEQDNSWEIEWIDEHRGGQLYGIGQNGVHQAYVDEGWRTHPVSTFEAGNFSFGTRGFTHDGEFLIIYANENEWVTVEDGVLEFVPRWLEIEPHRGRLVPDQSIRVSFIFNPVRLEDDQLYRTEILLNTNDPDASSVVIPVSLQTAEVGIDLTRDNLIPVHPTNAYLAS